MLPIEGNLGRLQLGLYPRGEKPWSLKGDKKESQLYHEILGRETWPYARRKGTA